MYLQSASHSHPISQRAAFPSLISHHFNVLLHVVLQLSWHWISVDVASLKLPKNPLHPPPHSLFTPSLSLPLLSLSITPWEPTFFPSSVFHVAFPCFPPSTYSSMCGYTLSYFNFMCISTSHLPSTRCSRTDVSKSRIQRVSDFSSLFTIFFFSWLAAFLVFLMIIWSGFSVVVRTGIGQVDGSVQGCWGGRHKKCAAGIAVWSEWEVWSLPVPDNRLIIFEHYRVAAMLWSHLGVKLWSATM